MKSVEELNKIVFKALIEAGLQNGQIHEYLANLGYGIEAGDTYHATIDVLRKGHITDPLPVSRSFELPTVGAVYKHYKGGLYRVLGIGKHTESKGDIVLYQSIDHGSFWARPLREWNDRIPIARQGATIPRFEKVDK